MFAHPTVIVVGAGASHDLDFPLGDGLRYNLSETFKKIRIERGGVLAGPERILRAIRQDSNQTGRDLNQYLRAARTLSSHVLYARSIDDFVDHYQEDPVLVTLAKIGICAAILEREKTSHLFQSDAHGNHTVNHEHLDKKDAWLKQLWYMLRQDVPRNQAALLFQNVAFVNFNYDRSLEAFLIRALVDMYGLAPDDAARLVENQPIYHPYGLVDKLTRHPGTGTPYGGADETDLVRLSGNIRTYCESEASPQKVEYQSHLANARNLVFLGFAYRQLNLDLLRCQRRDSLAIYGTAFKIPEENYPGIEGRLNSILQPSTGVIHVRFRNVRSAELLRLYEEPLIG